MPVRVARKDEVPEGEGRPYEVEGKPVAIFNLGGTFHAIANECCHKGGPLGEGELEGTTVTCPWHGWEFDVTTGSCVAPDTSESVPCYKVTLDGDDIQVEL